MQFSLSCETPQPRPVPILKRQTDNYSGAVYDFGMVIDRAEVPSAADYARRACAFCCGQVSVGDSSERSRFSSSYLPIPTNASDGRVRQASLPSDCC